MPLVTFTLLKGQPAALKIKLGHAVHLEILGTYFINS
jgi:hypothetical protein